MKKSSILVALLGVVIGLLIALLVYRVGESLRMLRVNGNDWRKVSLILQSIDENYVDSVDRAKVSEAIAAAALSALDPHSAYMPPQVLEDSEADLMGNFDGIGIQFNVPNDTAVVIEVIPGGPSEKIGLQPGDRLLKVDDTNIAGVHFPQDSMVRRIKGVAGSKVLVTVQRGREVIPFEITRGKIPTWSVDAAFMVSDTTGYLRLSKFSRTTEDEILLHCTELMAEGMKELILDLRDNSGGYLDQACKLSNFFLPRKAMIVYLEGRNRKREEFRADGSGPFQKLGVKLLVDEGSASASEILAGALQDNGRARLYGRRTFGKGLVQEPFFFSDRSGMRITVARYYTPAGRCIQKPYSDDYEYEVLRRYESGEMVTADSMRVEKGGILPDVFVPVDTTRAGTFYVACNRKATAMRFASAWFDAHGRELSAIDNYDALLDYLDRANLEREFLAFAKSKDGLVPDPKEWAAEKQYLMTQVQALVGRYSKLGDKAYYHLFLQIDDTFKAAMEDGAKTTAQARSLSGKEPVLIFRDRRLGPLVAHFADPKHDPEVLQPTTRLRMIGPEEIRSSLKKSGALDPARHGGLKALRYLAKESWYGGALDFSRNGEHDIRDGEFYLTRSETGELLIHNNYNYGNFLWGASARELGVPLPLVILGTHVQNFFGSRLSRWHLDSRDDVRSIRAGFHWAR